MKQQRLEALSDSIFGIAMTILIFEIKIPEFTTIAPSNSEIFFSLVKAMPLFLSFLLSFIVLFTYWKAHHFIVSSLAKNIDVRLLNINMLFFLFVCMIPFSAHLRGVYSSYEVAVVIFALNVIAIGYSLFWMRHHVIDSKSIVNEEVTDFENKRAYTRILLPIFLACLAVVLCIYSTTVALIVLTFGVLYNVSSQSTRVTFDFLNFLYGTFGISKKERYENENEIEGEFTHQKKSKLGRPKKIKRGRPKGSLGIDKKIKK